MEFSPLLWTLVIDGLLNQLVKSGFRCIGYADDIVIIIEGKVLPTLTDLMQHAFSLVESLKSLKMSKLQRF